MIFQCPDPLFIHSPPFITTPEGKVDPVSPHLTSPMTSAGMEFRLEAPTGSGNTTGSRMDGRSGEWNLDYWVWWIFNYFFSSGSAWGGIGWLVGWLVDVGIIIYMRCYDAGEDEGLFGEWEIGGGKRRRFFLLLLFLFLFFVEGVNLIYFGLCWNLFGARGLFIWDLFGRSVDLLMIGCYEWRIVLLGGFLVFGFVEVIWCSVCLFGLFDR